MGLDVLRRVGKIITGSNEPAPQWSKVDEFILTVTNLAKSTIFATKTALEYETAVTETDTDIEKNDRSLTEYILSAC